MSRHLLWGFVAFPILVILGLAFRVAELAERETPIPEPVGLACYVTVHPTSNDRDTVWVCFRLRP